MTTDAHDDLDPGRVAREAMTKRYPTMHCNQFRIALEYAILGARAMKAAYEAAGAKAAIYVSKGQMEAIEDRPGDDVGGVYLPIRKAPGGLFQFPLYAHPPTVAAERVKVKSLKWSDHPAGGRQAVAAGLGLYRVHRNGKSWYLDQDHMGDSGGETAAQADYEQRILSALEGGGAQEARPNDKCEGCDGYNCDDGCAYPGVAAARSTPAPGLVERLRKRLLRFSEEAEARFYSADDEGLDIEIGEYITALEADNKAKDARIADLEALNLGIHALKARATAAETELAALRGEVERISKVKRGDASTDNLTTAINRLNAVIDIARASLATAKEG
ncbi:hypothetical protein ACO2RV_16905 [Ancylobacter sp. VNQ12]|uniref:hypothetical protein n=1 Tax=Ancylobacter sp. VNQ12 TaxID=3400920 RepID=UPI003C03231C